MSTQSFRRQTQINFDVNVTVTNTDTSGNNVKDDITLYYADSLILDIAMGLFGDNVQYSLSGKPAYISINDNNITPYTKDLAIQYKYIQSTSGQVNTINNYIDSLKNYTNYKEVIKCSPFFRKTPMVNKHILGQKPTCVQEPIKYSFYNKSDVLINEKDWRNIVCNIIKNGSFTTFDKKALYNICSISSTFSVDNKNAGFPYHYGDGKKYFEMKSAINGSSSTISHVIVAHAFGFEIAYQLRRMSDKDYKDLVDVWLEKVKTTCYEDVKTRVVGEYVGDLNLDFSEFVAQRGYNEQQNTI